MPEARLEKVENAPLQSLTDLIRSYAGKDPKKFTEVINVARTLRGETVDAARSELRQQYAALAAKAEELGMPLRSRKK